MKPPSKEEIYALRDESGEGIIFCKRELQRKCVLEAVQNLPETGYKDFDKEIKEILEYLVNYK